MTEDITPPPPPLPSDARTKQDAWDLAWRQAWQASREHHMEVAGWQLLPERVVLNAVWDEMQLAVDQGVAGEDLDIANFRRRLMEKGREQAIPAIRAAMLSLHAAFIQRK